MDTDLMPGPGDLGLRVARRRRELGLTRDQLAARAGMAPGYLTYLEEHVAHIGSSGLARLADALQTTADELLGGPASQPAQGPDAAGPGTNAAGQSRRPVTLLFIHDAWLGPSSWEKFAGYFSCRGHECLIPEWPVTPTAAAADRGSGRSGTSRITAIVDRYDDMIRGMSNPPVIIGHGFGGLFTQLLLNRGVGAAGVAISPVPPSGITGAGVVALRWSVRALLSSQRRRRSATCLTFRQFKRSFTSTWPDGPARAAYERYSEPAPRQVITDRLLAGRRNPSRLVNYSYDDRAPLLIIAAKEDTLVPPSVAARNCRRYSSLAETGFAEFPGRSHLVTLERGWEEVAACAAGWLAHQLIPPPGT